MTKVALSSNEKKIIECGLYVAAPANLSVLLEPSEQVVFNAIRHLNNIGSRCISISLLRVYTGFSKATVQRTIKRLKALSFITVGKTCSSGTYYNVRYTVFGNAVQRLNSIPNPVERLRVADSVRGRGNERHTALIKEFSNTPFDTTI